MPDETTLYVAVPEDFDDWADTYDRSVAEYADKFPFEGYEQILDEVFRQARVAPGAAALDLGIGTGNLAARFLKAGCRVYGVDFAPKMLAAAQVKYPALRLAQADLLGDWPDVLRQSFDCQQFDAIVSAYTFHHFDLPAKVKLLARLAADFLAPGGRIAIGDVTFGSAAERDQARIRWYDLWEEEDYWIADETLSACRASGLDITFQQISGCGGVFILR